MELNKKVITKEAKQSMINVHSEKYIKAWLDVQQFEAKAAELQKEWELLSPEAKERVEQFITQRIANPDGKMVPEGDIAQAVSVKFGLDSCEQNLKKARLEFDFFADVVAKIQNI